MLLIAHPAFGQEWSVSDFNNTDYSSEHGVIGKLSDGDDLRLRIWAALTTAVEAFLPLAGQSDVLVMKAERPMHIRFGSQLERDRALEFFNRTAEAKNYWIFHDVLSRDSTAERDIRLVAASAMYLYHTRSGRFVSFARRFSGTGPPPIRVVLRPRPQRKKKLSIPFIDIDNGHKWSGRLTAAKTFGELAGRARNKRLVTSIRFWLRDDLYLMMGPDPGFIKCDDHELAKTWRKTLEAGEPGRYVLYYDLFDSEVRPLSASRNVPLESLIIFDRKLFNVDWPVLRASEFRVEHSIDVSEQIYNITARKARVYIEHLWIESSDSGGLRIKFEIDDGFWSDSDSSWYELSADQAAGIPDRLRKNILYNEPLIIPNDIVYLMNLIGPQTLKAKEDKFTVTASHSATR